jgi:hypothetical protein
VPIFSPPCIGMPMWHTGREAIVITRGLSLSRFLSGMMRLDITIE